MPLELIALIFQSHPLTSFSWLALIGLVWGLVAALGANLGHRRGLVWQTGFLLGLLFSGLLFAVYYSIRPLTHPGPIEIPTWVRSLALWPSVVFAGITAILSITLEVLMLSAPVTLLHSPWMGIETFGQVIAVLAFFSFTALGGYLGKLWYDHLPEVETQNVAA